MMAVVQRSFARRIRMRRFLLPAFALVALATPAFAATGVAGSYAYDAAASDNVETAIQKAIEPMNPIVRLVAKGRLEKTNQPYKHVAIKTDGGKLSVTTDGRAPIVVGNGASIKWTRPEDGEKLDVSMSLSGSTLTESFTSPDGKRVNVFSPSADGKKLTMAVTVTSPKLPKPLTYRLTYKRQ
jgi:hypothetical protein